MGLGDHAMILNGPGRDKAERLTPAVGYNDPRSVEAGSCMCVPSRRCCEPLRNDLHVLGYAILLNLDDGQRLPVAF